MEALNRKPDVTTVKKSMELADGTRIDLIDAAARKMRSIANNNKLSQYDKGVHVTAAKIRVDGQPVVFDDLMDCFTATELNQIIDFANDINKDWEEEDNPNE